MKNSGLSPFASIPRQGGTRGREERAVDEGPMRAEGPGVGPFCGCGPHARGPGRVSIKDDGVRLAPERMAIRQVKSGIGLHYLALHLFCPPHPGSMFSVTWRQKTAETRLPLFKSSQEGPLGPPVALTEPRRRGPNCKFVDTHRSNDL